MGRTVPSFRHAISQEKTTWREFRMYLGQKDRLLFDEIFTVPRLYISASMMACRPIRLQPILMSMIFHHFKQISCLGENDFESIS